jgi:hypothetical protein
VDEGRVTNGEEQGRSREGQLGSGEGFSGATGEGKGEMEKDRLEMEEGRRKVEWTGEK